MVACLNVALGQMLRTTRDARIPCSFYTLFVRSVCLNLTVHSLRQLFNVILLLPFPAPTVQSARVRITDIMLNDNISREWQQQTIVTRFDGRRILSCYVTLRAFSFFTRYGGTFKASMSSTIWLLYNVSIRVLVYIYIARE